MGKSMLEKDYVLDSAIQNTRNFINKNYRINEIEIVSYLINKARINSSQLKTIQANASELVTKVRHAKRKMLGIEAFLTQYALSSEEGIALMCLAEALLRVPDNLTMNNLIKDKISMKNWESHLGQSPSFFINATTWALMITGKILTPERAKTHLSRVVYKLIHQSGEGAVRKVIDSAIRVLSKQFIMGRTIDEALSRSNQKEEKKYLYSYDMLGEAALTAPDAERYFLSYLNAIEAIGAQSDKNKSIHHQPGVSIKLSALHPRYEEAQRTRVLQELSPKLLKLAQRAKEFNLLFTVDAEESDRLELSLDVIEAVFTDSSLNGWEGFGMAVQAYQKRAFPLLDWISELAKRQSRRMMVRLVKGAYWDSEIKKAQVLGLEDYPVFTRKAFTDVSYQACVKKMLCLADHIYPQFATHNAYSVAMILNQAQNNPQDSATGFELQSLYGMGKELYTQVVSDSRIEVSCRIYAPVGDHKELLPYLVRRLLENGANSSFIHRILDEKVPLGDLIQDPIQKAENFLTQCNEKIPPPALIFFPERKNSEGIDLTNRKEISLLMTEYETLATAHWMIKPLLAQQINQVKENKTANKVRNKQSPQDEEKITERQVVSPQSLLHSLGSVKETSSKEIAFALEKGSETFWEWSDMPIEWRIKKIIAFAELLENNKRRLMSLLCLEAGKTWNDAIAEVREAVDFCYYYSKMAENLLTPVSLKGYTGESNVLSLHPRGLILCISPWNFPLAIFTGQIIAALVVGNCVIAKPAEQSTIIASLTVQLMHQAGVPSGVIQLLPGKGASIGSKLVADHRIKGVIFTGSTQTANGINQILAQRGGEIIPLIAETGGQNAMIVDSSALLEQVVNDVITSAFGSAGQRCSALRVLFVQKEVYPHTIELLKGAMAELSISNPADLSTDVGPVIDKEALAKLKKHVKKMSKTHRIIYQSPLPNIEAQGYFMPPTAIEIAHISDLEGEVFGPILHTISYRSENLNDVIDQINSTGYGLTLGIHSRINSQVERIRRGVHAGNCYVNRNMIGAVVGLQPFGGEGLSGTGPKAGGPHYLLRLCHERTNTINTTAIGGNASLMSCDD